MTAGKRNVSLILNQNAGAAASLGPDRIPAALEQEGIHADVVRIGTGTSPEDAARRAIQAGAQTVLAAGGDGFSVLKDGTARVTGVKDIDALTAYLSKVSSAAAPLDPLRGIGRVQGEGCADNPRK